MGVIELKLAYDADTICNIIRQHAADHNPFRPGYAERADLLIRDDDGGIMNDDCTLTIEVELGDLPGDTVASEELSARR